MFVRLPTFYEQNLIPNWGNIWMLFGDICFHGAKVRDRSEWAKDEEM